MTFPTPVSAQLIPDGSLGNENSIINQVNDFRREINGGAIRGNFLFHSFKEFNINNRQSVYFNAPGISNIFTRVTGNNVSNISGTLGVNGNANLFLINPNGVVFGKGASLDLSGNFTATTASELTFGNNGLNFNAISPQNIPENIKINFPLNFGFQNNTFQNVGEIKIEGQKQNLSNNLVGSIVTELIGGQDFSNGLNLKPNQNLNLIASSIKLDGGTIFSNGGNINILAIDEGIISLSKQNIFAPSKVGAWGDVELVNGSVINAYSSNINNSSGAITIQARDINILNNSIVLSQNRGDQKSGNILLNSSRDLNIFGMNEEALKTGIYSETQGRQQGDGANIILKASDLNIQKADIRSNSFSGTKGGKIEILTNNLNGFSGSTIVSLSINTGQGGDINIAARENINFSPQTKDLQIIENERSTITAGTYNFGNGGNINISSENLTIEGTSIGTTNIPDFLARRSVNENLEIKGKAGNVNIKVIDTLKLAGKTIIQAEIPGQVASTPTTINSRIISETANNLPSGEIFIETNSLIVENEATIRTRSLSGGRPQSLTIEAKKNINIKSLGSIKSVVENPLPALIELGLLPDAPPQGVSGSLTLTTKELNVNNSTISVGNFARGNAGELIINSDRIRIANNASITAFSNSGQGGTVNINSRDIQITGASSITSSSEGTTTDANAGSINVDSDRIKVSGNSTIETNARGGNGGNINLNTNKLELVNANISANVGFINA
ncbi:MAG: filamentous hemagglutinin N-terminal domain-containing protein, partial [Prochloraceae cyanobacterium]